MSTGSTATGPAAAGPALPPTSPGRRALQGVAGAAVLISVLTVVSRVAGFGRTLVLTNTVPGCVGGIYTAANTVPNIVFEVVAGGALASMVVPVLAGAAERNDADEAGRTASALVSWALLVAVPVTVAGLLLARPWSRCLSDREAPIAIAMPRSWSAPGCWLCSCHRSCCTRCAWFSVVFCRHTSGFLGLRLRRYYRAWL